jgi:iron complex outermembrane receptor protein
MMSAAKKNNKRKLHAGLSLLLLPLLAPDAMAQTVDYGALEQLFGENVTTSATGQPQRVTEVPAAMEIVNADRIRRSGALHIPGALKQVAGLDFLQWGSNNYDISMRGYNQAFSQRMLVLVDGRQVYADHYGYTPWTSVPAELSAIRQIEVVKGPNTALFGFNAVSGVINIITFNPLYDEVNTLSVTGGSLGTIHGSAVTTFREEGRWGLRLSGSAGLDNDFSTPRIGATLPRAQNSRAAVNADGVLQINDDIQLTLDLSHSQTRANTITPAYAAVQDVHLISSAKAQLNADTGIGLVQFLAYTNWTEQKADDGVLPMNFHTETTVAQLQDVLQAGENHVLRAALEYRHNETGTSPLAGATISYDVISASLMWNWTVLPSLSWTNAARFDEVALDRDGPIPPGYPFGNTDWKRKFSEWSFNSGLVWNLDTDHTLRLLVSRGIQLPNIGNLGAYVAATPLYNFSGSPDVDDTEVMNYELNWDWRIAPFGAVLRSAVFWQRSISMIGLVGERIPGPTPFSVAANIGNSDAIGGEVALSGTVAEEWHWGLSYRLMTVKDKFTPFAQAGFAFADYQHTTPRHQIKAGLGWQRGNWEADAALTYQSQTQGLLAQPFGGTGLSPVGAYANMDARIAYRINDHVTLSLSGDNLLSDRQRQTAQPEIERRVLLNLKADF